MFLFWIHEMPVTCSYSGAFAAIRSLLKALRRWTRLSLSSLMSLLQYVIIDLVLGVIGGADVLAHLAGLSFCTAAVHSFDGLGAAGGEEVPMGRSGWSWVRQGCCVSACSCCCCACLSLLLCCLDVTACGLVVP